MEVQILNHRATRKVPILYIIYNTMVIFYLLTFIILMNLEDKIIPVK